MFRSFVAPIAAIVLCLGLSERAGHAEPFSPSVDAEYFWDGGVIPFVYATGALALGLRLFAEPPDTPVLFPESEGGEADGGDTVPEFAVAMYSVGFAGLIAAIPHEERWHHFKGYGQALVTTIAITEVAKNSIGRRRPIYQESTDDDLYTRRSFFSGHASITAAGTVYMGLYLSRNLLPRPSILKTASVLALGGLLVGVPYSRIVDNRHHPSDVLTGAVVGSALATVFYVYQEGRFQDEKESFLHNKRHRLQLVPNLRNPGLALVGRW
jgi:membrane-associated phospholipid phosphatase